MLKPINIFSRAGTVYVTVAGAPEAFATFSGPEAEFDAAMHARELRAAGVGR